MVASADKTKVSGVKHIQELDLGHSILRMRHDGIVQVNFGNKTDLDVKEVREILAATGYLTQGKKALVMNVAGSQTSATSAARDFAATEEAAIYTLAEAYIVNNLAQKIIGNFYVNFHKPTVPTKIFTNETTAVNWLMSLPY